MIFVGIQNYKNIEVYYWTISMLICFICYGYWQRSMATTVEMALSANKLIYFEAYLLPLLLILATCKKYAIEISKLFKAFMYVLAMLMTCIAWTGGHIVLYYKSVELIVRPMGSILKTYSGPIKPLHFIYEGATAVALIIIVAYCIKKKKKDINRLVIIYTLFGVASIGIYVLQKVLNVDYDILPFLLVAADVAMFWSYRYNSISDIESIVQTMHENSTKTGYVAFDLRHRFIGANDVAKGLAPHLSSLGYKRSVVRDDYANSSTFVKWIERFEQGDRSPVHIENGNRIYKYSINYFAGPNGETRGYLFTISDDTVAQQHVKFVNNYNDSLQKEIRQKTAKVSEIQQRVVLGLANMIENRDASTGGHVKRTSDIIHILVENIMHNHIASISRSLAEDIVRAAPMHDLGKIAVDNSILLKAGKLTDEEYAMMKTHSTKSGEIVLEILQNVEEQHFVNTAYNVARYHHERYDGKGYPEGLKGERIPIEARVMAIADVYDALVSKRVYKEAMSFEKAYQVMIEGMGTQFDPNLQTAFELSRAKFEEYYSRIN